MVKQCLVYFGNKFYYDIVTQQLIFGDISDFSKNYRIR